MLIVLADAELELVPEEMMRDELIRAIGRKEGKKDLLLDNFTMRKSIKKHFPGQEGRVGFPHISYLFVRMNEESLLNDYMKLDYAIHTKGNIIIEKRDLEGMGAGYEEFKRRMEEILEQGRKRMSLLEYLNFRGVEGNTVVLHPGGNEGLLVNDQLNYVMGGFPEGDFSSDLGSMRKFSIYGREATVPGIVEILHFKLYQQLPHP
jgi:rRNA small subunit pseudouridine methyltransferase Nep1